MVKELSRRQFLKVAGAASVAGAAAMAGCKSGNETKAEGVALGEVPEDKMTMRENLHGEQVSLLGYGCMRFPTISGESGREQDQELDQDAVNSLVDYAIGHGVNLFDTAPPYCKGRSEHSVGIALSRHKRDEYFVSTKLSNFSPSTWSREESIKMYHNSMKELQVDYLDYYMLHSIGGTRRDENGVELDPMQTLNRRFFDNGMLDYLCEEREKGHIHNLGFSYHGDIQVFDYLLKLQDEGKYHWDHVLIQHNYVDWNHSKLINESNTNSSYLYGELAKRNIPVFVMEPLLGGQLANLNDHAVDLLKQRAPQASIASWAFRFAGNQPRILTVLSGMTYMEHLQDNIRTYSPHKPLTDEELRLLEEIADVFANFKTIPCTNCKYCMPCPYGIDIPTIFAHYNKCLNEGHVIDIGTDSEEKRQFRRARRAFLVDYDRAVPSFRQADHCIGCNHCVSECPQGINIPEQMQRINDYVESLKLSM